VDRRHHLDQELTDRVVVLRIDPFSTPRPAPAMGLGHAAAGVPRKVVTLGSPRTPQQASHGARRLRTLRKHPLSLTTLDSERTQVGATPVVTAAEYDDNMRSIGQLADAACIAEITEALADLGHRRFLHVTSDYAHTSARNRKQVYLETIDKLGHAASPPAPD
jgi:hypothetical protein